MTTYHVYPNATYTMRTYIRCVFTAPSRHFRTFVEILKSMLGSENSNKIALEQSIHYKELFDQGHKYNVPYAEELVSGVHDFKAVMNIAENIKKQYKNDIALSIRIAILRTAIREIPESQLKILEPVLKSASEILSKYRGIKVPDYINDKAKIPSDWPVKSKIESAIIDAELTISKHSPIEH